MNEFQQFMNKLSQTKQRHPTPASSTLPPRKFPKQQFKKFNHRIEIGLLVILILAGAGAGFYYHQQSQRPQTTVQHHRSKRSNDQKLIRPTKVHHHVNHKAKTKPRQKQTTRPNHSQSSGDPNASIATPQSTTSTPSYADPQPAIAPAETFPNYRPTATKRNRHSHIRKSKNKSKRSDRMSIKNNHN